MSPTQARAMHTRAAMIDAAAGEFADHGYAGTSLSRVMKRIGGQPGHLYYYFATKDSIATAVVDQQLARLHLTVHERRYDGLVGLEIIADLVAQIAQDLADGDSVSHATVTLAADPSARDAGIVSPVARWIRDVSALIDEAIGMRQIDSHLNPDDEAVSFVSALLGLYAVRHDVAASVGNVYSMATRRCIGFFRVWGCERAVEIMEASLERASADAPVSDGPAFNPS